MPAVTAHVLKLLITAKQDNEMIYVRVKDPTGHRYAGKVASLMTYEHRPTVDIEAEDGEVVWAVPVSRILFVDVRPRESYTGYGAAHFVSDFGADVS